MLTNRNAQHLASVSGQCNPNNEVNQLLASVETRRDQATLVLFRGGRGSAERSRMVLYGLAVNSRGDLLGAFPDADSPLQLVHRTAVVPGVTDVQNIDVKAARTASVVVGCLSRLRWSILW